MSAQHTPGLWHIRKNSTRLIVEGPNARMVAETLEYIPSDGEALANARLIAAAPELLAFAKTFALWESKGIIKTLPPYEGNEAGLRALCFAAIAKATEGQQ